MQTTNGVQETEDGHSYYVVEGTETIFSTHAYHAVREAQERICNYIAHEIYPDDPVLWVSLEEVQAMIRTGIAALRKQLGELPVISLSGFYYPRADERLECNRIVSRHGDTLGIGPRPGAESIPDQVNLIRCLHPDTSFIVVDDMLFHGQTVDYLLARKMPIAGLATAFANSKTGARLEERGVKVSIGHKLTRNMRDMMPMHDFLPPLPLCGKVVSLSGQLPIPTFARSVVSLSLPYLLPWATHTQLNAWASIPEKHAVSFSRTCLEASYKIFAALHDNNIVRTLADLQHLYPRASCPYNGNLVDPNEEIPTMLRRSLHQLADCG